MQLYVGEGQSRFLSETFQKETVKKVITTFAQAGILNVIVKIEDAFTLTEGAVDQWA